MLESILSRFGLTADTLLADPALWLCATLLAYAFGMWVYKKSGYKTICTPLLVAIVLLVVTLEVTGTDYKTYINGYEQRLRLAKMWVALTCGLVAGGTVAIVSAVLIAGALGASPETMISLAPKSVTVPIAMAVSEHLGGIPALTAALVVITGVVGSLMARSLLGILREKDDAVRGFSIGLAAHGVGTATAFQMNRDTGAFSGLAMGLTGLFTAFAAPFLLPYLLSLFE